MDILSVSEITRGSYLSYLLQTPFSCRSLEKGNIVNWENAKFDLVNMTEKEVPMESVCKPVKPGDVIIPNKRSFESLMSLCKKFHGKTSVVDSPAMQDELSKLVLETPMCMSAGGKELPPVLKCKLLAISAIYYYFFQVGCKIPFGVAGGISQWKAPSWMPTVSEF